MTLEKHAQRAIPLFAVAKTFIETGDVRGTNPIDEIEYERYLSLAQAQLDQVTFNTAWNAGKSMSMEQAIGYALEDSLPE